MCEMCHSIERRPSLAGLPAEYLMAAVADLTARPTLDPRERESLTMAQTELRIRVAALN